MTQFYNQINLIGSCGGLVVNVIIFYSDDPSLNPSEAYNVYVKSVLEKFKINKKRQTMANF